MGPLPSLLNESSGVDVDPWGRIWTHNDSGNEANIYQIALSGAIIRTVNISNAENIDWEDISIAPDGRMFIGDFGNNNNDRQDLKIYIVDLNILTNNQQSIQAEVINFSYANQSAFPPNDALKHFDMEAMAFKNNHLFLFSKNRGVPNDGLTRIYKLPAATGTYQITPIETFFTAVNTSEGRITGADFSEDGSSLLLISNAKFWHFTEIEGDFLSNATVSHYNFSQASQKEAICFYEECKFLVTDESNPFFPIGRNLYLGDLCTVNTNNQIEAHGRKVWFDGGMGQLNIQPDEKDIGAVHAISIFDLKGQCHYDKKLLFDCSFVYILFAQLPDGIFFCSISKENGTERTINRFVRNR